MSNQGRSHQPVLSQLSQALDPEVLGDFEYELRGLVDCEVPEVTFEPRAGLYVENTGRTSMPLGASKLTISSLLDVEWVTKLDDARMVDINASPDFSGRNHPALQVIEYPDHRRLTGSVRRVTDEDVVDWLGNFLSDLQSAQQIVETYWEGDNRPFRPQQKMIFDIVTRDWYTTRDFRKVKKERSQKDSK